MSRTLGHVIVIEKSKLEVFG